MNQWPHFSYEKEVLAELEYAFSQNSGTILGVFRHMQENSKDDFVVEVLSNDALKKSSSGGYEPESFYLSPNKKTDPYKSAFLRSGDRIRTDVRLRRI